MTSLDIYNELVKDLDTDLLASQRQSRRSQSQQAMEAFEIAILDCRKKLDQVRQNNDDILRLKNRLMENARPQKQAQLCASIKKICDDNYKLVTDLRQQVIAAGKIVESVRKQFPQQPQTFSKIYRKQHLTEQVDKVLKETFTIQKMVQKFSIDTSLKRIRLIMPELSEEQAKKLASKANGLEQVVMSKLTGKASLKLKYAHSDILSKAEGIIQLQKSVQQNLKLMQQVGLLVQQQGEAIDSIFKNVTQAKNYVTKAEANLVAQKKRHKTSRKVQISQQQRICCIIFVGLAILGLILAPIIIKIVKSNQNSTTTDTTTVNSTLLSYN